MNIKKIIRSRTSACHVERREKSSAWGERVAHHRQKISRFARHDSRSSRGTSRDRIKFLLILTFSVETEFNPIKGIASLMVRKNFVKYDDFSTQYAIFELRE